MRLVCKVEGLEQNWVEVPDKWTRADWQRILDATVEDALALVRERATACHIERGDGTAITDPAQVTAEALEAPDMDLAVYGFVVSVPGAAVRTRRSLGNLSARLSPSTSAVTS